MAVSNFIPDLWSAKLLVALRKAHVSGALVNRDYEGEIKRQGDSVKITSINDVTIGTYTAHNDITVEDIDDATRSLLIDQANYFAVELDDIEKAQQVKGGRSALDQAVDNAGYQLANTADAFLLDLINDAAEATGNDLGTVAIHTTAKNLYDAFVDLGVKLDEANVPDEGRFVVVSPAIHGRVRKLDEWVGVGDLSSEIARTRGLIGQIGGLPVYKSNNLPAVTDVAATGGLAIAGYRGATTFAEQIVSVEGARMEKRFADMVKGLHVYGAKVVRPTGVAKVEFDATA
jgi:N4-gp56 family major capsid protein